MNVNFGIMDPWPQKVRKKKEKNALIANRALEELDALKAKEKFIRNSLLRNSFISKNSKSPTFIGKTHECRDFFVKYFCIYYSLRFLVFVVDSVATITA